MVKLNFQDKTVEKVFRHWRWNRNNTLLLFEKARDSKVLDFVPTYKSKGNKDKSILYQFQCLATTTDTRYRLMTGGEKQFGVFIKNGKVIQKENVSKDELLEILNDQIKQLESVYKLFNSKKFDEHIYDMLPLTGHEHLHQGQLIVLFREAGIDFPDRFKKAWAL